MGNTSSFSRAERGGMCAEPIGMDPRVFALVQIHGIPWKRFYLNLYPEYDQQMACEDIAYHLKRGKPKHEVVNIYKITKSRNLARYVFKKVYKMSPRGIGEHYTQEMAVKELKYQEMRRRRIMKGYGPELGIPEYRFRPGSAIKFTNTKRGRVYRETNREHAMMGVAMYAAGMKHAQKHTPSAPPPPPNFMMSQSMSQPMSKRQSKKLAKKLAKQASKQASQKMGLAVMQSLASSKSQKISSGQSQKLSSGTSQKISPELMAKILAAYNPKTQAYRPSPFNQPLSSKRSFGTSGSSKSSQSQMSSRGSSQKVTPAQMLGMAMMMGALQQKPGQKQASGGIRFQKGVPVA